MSPESPERTRSPTGMCLHRVDDGCDEDNLVHWRGRYRTLVQDTAISLQSGWLSECALDGRVTGIRDNFEYRGANHFKEVTCLMCIVLSIQRGGA